jgi:energy-converting hydrogenase Eha subunit H
MSRPLGQKISLAFAVLCYVAAAGCAVGAALYDSGRANDPIQASLMASVIFFVGAGIVLHVIGTARLKGIVTLPKADAGRSEDRAS